MNTNATPPALAALAAFPHLQEQAGRWLAAQSRLIAERTTHFIPRPALLKTLDERVLALSGGLIALEGALGSGTTALLCHLAATRPYAFWLPEDDAGAGLEALCAQLLALHDLPVPLVPPAAGRDATTLERLLAEAGARRPLGDPLVVLIDRPADEHTVPRPPAFLSAIPPGVVVVLACAPKASLPIHAAGRIALPTRGPATERHLAQAAVQRGCPPALAVEVAARGQGSFLYVHLTAGLLKGSVLEADRLPDGQEALHQEWWSQLEPAGRRLASLVAAAGEPLDPALAATLSQVSEKDARLWLRRWQPFLEFVEGRARLYHNVTRSFIAAQSGDALASAHAAYVALARERTGGQIERLSGDADGYLMRQIARHIALSDASTRASAAPALATRAWVVARERSNGTMRDAAQDIAWELRMASHDGGPLRLVRAAALAGTLTLLSRTLHHDAPAEAFGEALKRGGAREGSLKRVRAMVDQLPDGRDKALALRRLGEVCYALRMRSSAMRMLSEALDLETGGLPRAWRDQREETLVAFARAAVAIDVPQTALGITARIGHAERRGLIETEVVRWLLARGQRTRAEEVAYAIGHQAMHEWAMAEVAVGHARAGDPERAEMVLSTLKTETAVAWARGELACDAARAGDPRAAESVMSLANPSLRDRALALVAQALSAGRHPDAALEAARTVEDHEIRARALIDLALLHSASAPIALALAATDIAAITGEDRASLVAALAAAQAAVGSLSAGLDTAAQLTESEEHDRAQSRIAIALARSGDEPGGRRLASAIGDDDERFWALDELARLVAGAGDWAEAFGIAAQIGDTAQRARTEADLTIAWARAGAALEAHDQAARIALPSEQARAYAAITVPLVAAGGKARALATLANMHEPDPRSRYQAALTAALAAHGELVGAQGVARSIARPFDRARALVAIARAAAPIDREQAHQTLGEALRVVTALGRSETFTCLEWAAETLAKIGGAELLLAAASALDEVDSWWG
jgi:hypothetical protein